MLLLKNINYAKMLYSTMGRYFSINSSGQLSRLYKYCLCLLWPFQLMFNTFDAFRRKKILIAYCNWQVGQLTNLLNNLYDPVQKRIYISQAGLLGLMEPDIDYESTVFANDIDASPLTSSDSLGVAGISYIVNSGLVTYNGNSYTIGQTFTTVLGVTAFTGTGTVVFNTFAPDIDSNYVIRSEVYINLPSDIYSDTPVLLDIINTLDQIKIAGLTYLIPPS